jgi:hypothetical protein
LTKTGRDNATIKIFTLQSISGTVNLSNAGDDRLQEQKAAKKGFLPVVDYLIFRDWNRFREEFDTITFRE